MLATTLPAPWTASKFAVSIHHTVVNREGRPSSGACGSTLAYHRLALLSNWRDHKAQEHLCHMIDMPIFQLRRELLRRNFEKGSQWFGVREPEHVSDRSNHEHLEGDRIVCAKLVMKDVKNQRSSGCHMGCPPMSESVHFHRGYSLRLHKSKPLIN